MSSSFTLETFEVLEKMNKIVSLGVKPLDALHISCAIFMNCDYFLTVDNGILKKMDDFQEIKVINPVNFVVNR